MSAEEIWIASRIECDGGTDFQNRFLKDMRREVKRKRPAITNLQGDWLWEFAWLNRKRLAAAGAGSIVAEADLRHTAFSFRQRVKKTRQRARFGVVLPDIEVKIRVDAEPAQRAMNAISGFRAAAAASGASLQEFSSGLALFGNALALSQPLLPMAGLRDAAAEEGSGSVGGHLGG